jgi:hypothetical protein
MADVPRGRTDAEEAALILRGHERRLSRLEEDRESTELVQTFRSIADAVACADTVSATLDGDATVTDTVACADTVSASAKSVGSAVYRDSNETARFTTSGRVAIGSSGGDGFGEETFGSDGFGA